MALRNIRHDGDPVLRKISKVVTEVTPRINDLIEDMFDTMYESNGVGLAAPQVGILKRVIVVDVGDEENPMPQEFINPEIISQEGLQDGEEGCLSIPGVAGLVERPMKVKVKAMDKNGKEFTIETEGLYARCLCHEIDHLNGILFTDKARFEENTEEI